MVLYPERDGMATLAATLPASEAVGVFAVLDQHARACCSTDGRSMDARRADALTDLVLDGTGFSSSGGVENADDLSAEATATADELPQVQPRRPACLTQRCARTSAVCRRSTELPRPHRSASSVSRSGSAGTAGRASSRSRWTSASTATRTTGSTRAR